VASLNVDSRDKNAGIEEGRYSAVGGSAGAGEDEGPENLNGNALRVRVAARVRIAVRCGVFFENVREDSSVVGLLLRVFRAWRRR
jgi:hypothetical protein